MIPFPLRLASALVALCLVLGAGSAWAQSATALDSLQIELWPEFDNPSTLVILSGTLPPTASLPAEVAVRIPAAAVKPHAVAMRDPAGQLLTAQFTTVRSGEEIAVTLTTNFPNFRLEYYDPALIFNAKVRDYTFRWTTDSAVQAAVFRVQEPYGATNLSFDPALTMAGPGDFGLTYYTASLGQLAAGQSVTLRMGYSKPDSTFSADMVGEGSPLTPDLPAPPPATVPWPTLIAVAAGIGLLLVGGGAYWFVRSTGRTQSAAGGAGHGRRRGRRRSAPGPTAEAGQSPPTLADAPPRYCSQCGQPLLPGDQFCRNCGARVRP